MLYSRPMTDKNDQLPWDAASTTKFGLFALLEKLTKVAVVLLAVSYALGLLVTNQALIGLGVSDYSSVRPKYVLTGLWSLLLIVSVALPILLPLLYNDASKSKTWRVKRAATNFIVALFAVITVDIATFSFLGFHLDFAPRIILSDIGLFILVVWSALAFTLYGALLLRFSSAINQTVAGLMLIVFFLCFNTVGTTHLIAKAFYRHIPEASGGGERVYGSLILKKDGGEDFWKEAGIAPDADLTSTARSRFVSLLYQDEHLMVIQVLGKGVLKRLTLNRTLVDAFVTEVSATDTSTLNVGGSKQGPSSVPGTAQPSRK